MARSSWDQFESLEDPRKRRGRRHLLPDIMVIALCAVICSAEDWGGVAAFGRAKEKWFGSFLQSPYGIPSRDTFERVFAAMNPEALERCFEERTRALAGSSRGPVGGLRRQDLTPLV